MGLSNPARASVQNPKLKKESLFSLKDKMCQDPRVTWQTEFRLDFSPSSCPWPAVLRNSLPNRIGWPD